MAALQSYLAQQGLQFRDAGSAGNNCFLLSVLQQLLGADAAADVADHMRQLTADYVEQQLADEGEDGLLTAAIRAYAGLPDDCARDQLQAAISSHMAGLRRQKPLTDVGMAGLSAVMQQAFSASITIYSPAYTNSSFSMCYTDADSAVQHVRIAYVRADWVAAHLAGDPLPKSPGPLNHFVVVEPAQRDRDAATTSGTRKRPAAAAGGDQQAPKRQAPAS
jgi:hypothetical protein